MSVDHGAPEANWLQQIAGGGTARDAATEALFHRYARRFRQYFSRRGATAADAEELCQETFIKIIRSVASAGTIDQPRAWLWSVASSVLVDFLRRQKPVALDLDQVEEMDATSINPSSASLTSGNRDGELERRAGLQQCVDRQFEQFAIQYPDSAQAVVWASVDQMTAPEIGALIGRTPQATRQFLTQVRKRVREFLAICRDYLD